MSLRSGGSGAAEPLPALPPLLPMSISPLWRSRIGGGDADGGGGGETAGGALGRSTLAAGVRPRRGVGSASPSVRVVTSVSGPTAPPASSRYGLSPVSASVLLDGRRPRPRRGGRRLSVMPLLGKKVNLVRSARVRCGPCKFLSRAACPGDPQRIRPSGSLAATRISWMRSMRGMTGIKCGATRALLSVPSGRGQGTRFRRCWRSCAARRTTRVSPLLQLGATLGSPFLGETTAANFVPGP